MPQDPAFGGKQRNTYHELLIALGGNLNSPVGAPAATLRSALSQLTQNGAVIRSVSTFYHTPAFPKGSGPDYVNAVAKISAYWSPAEALDQLHQIEAQMARERDQRWGQRTLDLDILAYDDVVLPDRETYDAWRNLPPEVQIGRTPEQLILPHPRMQDRAFVLVPLADVAPDWVHPVLQRSVIQMLEALPEAEKAEIIAINEVTS